jgi:GNAT superfamily N-acetyltransferase
MPTFRIYQQSDFPAAFKWQAVSFMRCEWPFIFTGELTYLTESYLPELAPVHFVAAEGEVLLSYAAVITLSLNHAGRPFRLYGFGNMFTFPPYRQKGYGRRVLELATEFILNSGVDLSILFCDPQLESFYARTGWQIASSPTRIGTPEQYELYQAAARMMLFVSGKGQRFKESFEEQPVYVGWTW